tara:strand:+ start:135 stop:425 length:291 start_codon:yes stop_codon:yes gene_type:complete
MENAVHAGDEDNPKEDMNTKGEDHACDDTRYFVMGALSGKDPDKKEGPSHPTPNWYKKIKKRNDNRESFMVPDSSFDLDEAIMQDLIVDGVSEALS